MPGYVRKSVDPRSDAERARADLMRNDAIGMTVPESPLERQPSVTPATFGDRSEAAELRSGIDQGVEAGGARPPTGDAADAESIAESSQVSAGRDHTEAARTSDERKDEDLSSRDKE